MSSVNSSVKGSSVVMLNGSWANNSRFRTKTPHWPINQMATHKATRFCVPNGAQMRNRLTQSASGVRHLPPLKLLTGQGDTVARWNGILRQRVLPFYLVTKARRPDLSGA
jgi:hypothetical protein